MLRISRRPSLPSQSLAWVIVHPASANRGRKPMLGR
jgi:hypothetical protein